MTHTDETTGEIPDERITGAADDIADGGPDGDQPPPSTRRGCWRRLFFAALLLVAGAGAVWWGLHQFIEQQPEFYSVAIQADPQQQLRDGSELERKLLELHNSSLVTGQWTTEFSDSEVNGWLASGMHAKFPELMPAEISDPRVNIEPGRFRAAFRSHLPALQGVLSVDADLFLTEQVNEVGVRLHNIKLGALPLPTQSFHSEVTAELAKHDVKVAWTEEAGDPVMLIELPDSIVERSSGVWIELLGIELLDGSIRFTGQSNPLEY